MMQDERLLVVSAHAADFVWRAGGTIAKYVKNGAQAVSYTHLDVYKRQARMCPWSGRRPGNAR